MSQIGAGFILVLPLAAIGVIAGAALVAGAGGVLVAQAGKGVVACGRYVGETIQQHAAQQRAIYELCDEYERRVRRGAQSAVSLTQTASAAERAKLLARLSARNTLAKAAAPEPPLSIPEDPGLQEDPTLPSGIYVHSDLDRQADRLTAELADVEQALHELEQPQWLGLVAIDDLNRQLAELKQAIEHNRAAAAGEPARLGRDLKRELHALRAGVAYRAAEGHAKHAQRQRAAQTLVAAGKRLEEKAQALRDEPELEPALEVAADMLARADELFQEGDLAGAQETAQTALGYIDQLAGSLAALRHANLEAAIQSLQEYVAGFGFPPDDSAPLLLNNMLAEAAEHLRAVRLDACWETLAEAQQEAGRLAGRVERQLSTAQRDAAIKLAKETLTEMDYTAGAISVDEGGWAGFKATRTDGAYFLTWVTPDGLLQYKAEGFGTAECQKEAARFFEKLKERGLHVSTQSEFNMVATAERMREVLLRLGFTIVTEEPAPDGTGTVITATRSDGTEYRTTVDHESPPVEEAAKPAPGESPTDQYTARARRLQREAQRRYTQSLQEQLRRRLRN